MKKSITTIIALILVLSTIFCLAGCGNQTYTDPQTNSKIDSLAGDVGALKEQLSALQSEIAKLTAEPAAVPEAPAEFSEKCYEKLVYIDKTLSDRDCMKGAQFKLTQTWIQWTLMCAGYSESDIVLQDMSFSRYMTKAMYDTLSACEKSDDGKLYVKEGRSYTESETGTYINATITTPNIILKKQGKSDKQIIVGAHYDGDGTGDNGSGIALALTMAEELYSVETEYSVVFIFFTAEEYGCKGSTAYAQSMTDKEISDTLYMINMDSLVCGDYCYLYGGIQDDETQTVSQTHAYDNAVKVAESLGITFKSNPWTYDNPAPGYDSPDYASPSTGDWSDHVGFKNIGIPYVYFEATNWEIPGPSAEYDGYGETYLIGMLMNTENDYLEYIEKYFPGRPTEHFEKFSALLWALLTQSDYQ